MHRDIGENSSEGIGLQSLVEQTEMKISDFSQKSKKWSKEK